MILVFYPWPLLLPNHLLSPPFSPFSNIPWLQGTQVVVTACLAVGIRHPAPLAVLLEGILGALPAVHLLPAPSCLPWLMVHCERIPEQKTCGRTETCHTSRKQALSTWKICAHDIPKSSIYNPQWSITHLCTWRLIWGKDKEDCIRSAQYGSLL